MSRISSGQKALQMQGRAQTRGFPQVGGFPAISYSLNTMVIWVYRRMPSSIHFVRSDSYHYHGQHNGTASLRPSPRSSSRTSHSARAILRPPSLKRSKENSAVTRIPHSTCATTIRESDSPRLRSWIATSTYQLSRSNPKAYTEQAAIDYRARCSSELESWWTWT